MSEFHIDERCNHKFIELNDALCTFERATDRQYLLILIPESSDEDIVISQSGKPLPPGFDMPPEELVKNTIELREKDRHQQE